MHLLACLKRASSSYYCNLLYTQDCNSNTGSLPRQNTRADSEHTNGIATKFPNNEELDVLKSELEKLRTERTEYHKQGKEIEVCK